MINDPFHPEEAIARQKETSKRMVLAIVCAVAVTAILLAGYGYIRRFHAKEVLANQPVAQAGDNEKKGPPVAHILVDEPTIEKGSTTIGGVVKNISERELTGLSVTLELYRRKGGSEQKQIAITPNKLQPKEEGSYAVRLSTSEYASIKLVGLSSDPNSAMIAYTSGPGKKRAVDRIEPKVIVMKKPGKPGEFINTPDNPSRVP